ncbi:lysophospholipid acyltransferase family protein [Steroidobacter sp.]|uniref:lysophospholipid acyltransferase family protein n=1 Tax=Steroidobacter sp. TaxID=1978227 RepID=UPI001A3E00F6|nr:lysophospholipid acyltransferase family protein [Steroidobacter sp.]MBL8267641.1 1-acyl-sn-glycerol-3-phosphate acyltransferase [Steroidobacter sp.]
MNAEPQLAEPAADRPEGRGDYWLWRFFVTGFSFSLFGVGALVVGVVLLPIVKLIPASRDTKRRRARAVMSAALRFFIGVMHRGGGLTYEFHGRERLGRPGQMVVANHPSLIDVVFLLAFTPNAGCVVKQGLWRNPLTRWAVTLVEFIPNDQAASMIERAATALSEGQTLIFFPEGTRTRPNQPMVFHRGAANVALRGAALLTPVYIRCQPTTLTKAEPWYRIPPRRPHFSFAVGQDLDLSPYRNTPLPLASRALNEAMHRHFQQALAELVARQP